MDVSKSDADFDSYWEDESRNKNRNRIRVGRQYQATLPPLLKPGESDGRRSEELETLRWKPESLTDQNIEQYLSMAKAVSLFARAIDKYQSPEESSDKCLQTALRGLSDFVMSHHPCHHDAGCQVPTPGPPTGTAPSEWTPNEAKLFATALEACGKNFSAIKKDFLPWKPVKSIIEYYYQGSKEKCEKSESANETPKSLDEPGCSGTSVTVKKEETEEEEESKQETNTEDMKDCITMEVKPMKAKILKPEDISSSSSMGSLKFYLDGRLVLKLSAQQPPISVGTSGNQRCTWVEAHDTPRLSPSRKRRPKKRSSGEKSPTDEDNTSEKVNSDSDESVDLAPKKQKFKRTSSSISWPETALPQSIKKAPRDVDGEDTGEDSMEPPTLPLCNAEEMDSKDVKMETKVEELASVKTEPLCSPVPHPQSGRSSDDKTELKCSKKERKSPWLESSPQNSCTRSQCNASEADAPLNLSTRACKSEPSSPTPGTPQKMCNSSYQSAEFNFAYCQMQYHHYASSLQVCESSKGKDSGEVSPESSSLENKSRSNCKSSASWLKNQMQAFLPMYTPCYPYFQYPLQLPVAGPERPLDLSATVTKESTEK